MKNIVIGVFIGTFTLITVYFFLTFRERTETIPRKTALIIIKNKSDYKIRKATLKHGYGELLVSDIESNDITHFGFTNHSENDYLLSIELENDSILKSVGQYFEQGIKVTETVYNSFVSQEVAY